MMQRQGFSCHAMAVDYGQRHRFELHAAAKVAAAQGAESFRIIQLDLRSIGGSALTADIAVPKDRDERTMMADIPVTYVPARNLIMLSLATGLAEALGARHIAVGVNAVDYSGYPDCRPAFIESFQRTANIATKAGISDQHLTIHAPIIAMTKPQIIAAGTALGVDYGLTHSCYDPVISADVDGQPIALACGRCDSCSIRRQGFADAGIADPTRYAAR